MAEIDFPDDPTPGQVYDQWTWNGSLWVLTPVNFDGGSGFTFVQDTTPPASKVGDTWWNTATGDSFVWTFDIDSYQWVQFAPGGGGGGGGDGGSGFTFVQDTKPTPKKQGDTWFDTSSAATGGTSWVAMEEGLAGSEKVWVQFAPGSGAPLVPRQIAQATLTPSFTITAAEQVIPFSGSIIVPPGSMTVNAVAGNLTVTQAGLYRATLTYTANMGAGWVAGNYLLGYIQHCTSVGGVAASAEALAGGTAAYASMVADRLYQMQAGEFVRATTYIGGPSNCVLRSGILLLERVG